MRSVWKLVLIIFCVSIVNGQQDGEFDDLMLLSLEDIMNMEVVTASKKAQSFSKVPATMVVINEQMIKERGYHHLEEILHDVPGFDFNKGYGVNYSTIFMRGYRSDNSDRFILLYDGILENDIWKQTNWITRQYPVSNIKQIEILYGPASALYGTNAFSGIINVITKKADEQEGLHITASGGSYLSHNVELTFAKKLNETVSFNVTGKYFGQDDLHDWDFMKLKYKENFSSEFATVPVPLVSKNGENVPGDYNGKFPLNDMGIHANLFVGDLKLTAWAWVKNETEGFWYTPFKRRGSDAEWNIGYQSYKASHNWELSDKISLTSDLMYRSHGVNDSRDISQKYKTKPDDVDPNIKADDITTFLIINKGNGVYGTVYYYNSRVSDWSFEEQLTWDITDQFNFISGVKVAFVDTQEDYNWSDKADAQDKSPRHDKTNIGFYAQGIYSVTDDFDVVAGFRTESSKDENDEGYDILTPRLSLVYSASEEITFRLQYAEAFQEADDWHKFATESSRPAPSPNLEPEKLKSVEFGATFKPSKDLLMIGSVYQNNIENLIASDNYTYISPNGKDTLENAARFINKGESTIIGYELSFNYSLSESMLLNGNVSGAFNEETGGREIGDIAPIKLNLGLLYKVNKQFSLYPKINYVTEKNTVNHDHDKAEGGSKVPAAVKKVDGYAIIGLYANYQLMKGLHLNMKVDNLLNTKYYNPGPRSADNNKYNATVLQPGINFMVGLNYSL